VGRRSRSASSDRATRAPCAELDVVESHRRRGIGTLLVEASMMVARRTRCTRFSSSTGGHDDIAEALCERLGGDRKPLGDVNYWWELT
jgi:GNAT superfamily N-acetyltransferase